MHRNIISLGLVLLFIAIIVGYFSIKTSSKISKDISGPTSGVIKQGMQLGKFHESITDRGKVVVGDPNAKNATLKPQLKLSKWDEEARINITYPIASTQIVAEDNAIVWKGKDKDLIYRQVPAQNPMALQKIPRPKIRLVQANNTIRYIKYGLTDLKTLAASYEVFEKTDASQPTITSFIPNEEGYLFFGTREAERDLKNISVIPYPIVRVKTENTFNCPVALSNNNGLFLVMYYSPDISSRGEEIKNKFTESINNVLKRHDVDTEIRRQGDFFYYLNGAQIKPVGRIAYDKNILIFNLYTKSPYTTGLKDYMRITFQKIRDEYLLPIGGLTELNSSITPQIVDEVVKEFADSNQQSIHEDALNNIEKSILDGIVRDSDTHDWKTNALRSDISTGDDFDKFEFDILLHQKPESNVFIYDIETEGLDFFYQPPLSEEEKDSGKLRPENVIGSYAVYKKGAKNIYQSSTEAEKYKIGKIMHIYRPKITDANNKSIWGELHINTTNKTLTVTVDKDWLNSASYPVLIDPTFGYTSVGASSLGIQSNPIGAVFSGETGNVTSMTAYLVCANSNYVFGLLQYSPQTVVTKLSDQGLCDGDGWYSQNIASSPVLSGTTYDLAIVGKSAGKGSGESVKYDTGSGLYFSTGGWGYDFVVSNFWPTWTAPATNVGIVSIYATYTVGGTKSNLKGNLNLRGNVNFR